MASILSSRQNTTAQGKALYAKLEKSAQELEQDIAALRHIDASQTRSALHRIEQKLTTNDHVTNPAEKERENRAWGHYLKTGIVLPEHRDLITTGASGSALLPQQFESKFTDALKYYGPVADLVSSKQEDSLYATKFPVYNDTGATFTLVAEGTSIPTEIDPVVTSDVSLTDTISTIVSYSFQFEKDAFDVEDFFNNIVAARAGRALEAAITNAVDGAGTALPNSPVGGLLKTLPSAGTTAAANVVSYSDLAALHSSIDNAYRQNAVFMASQSVNDYLAAQVSSTGKRLYKTNPNTGRLILVQGKELVINAAMPSLTAAANSPIVVFGDLARAYGYSFGGVRVKTLNERFAESLTKALVVYMRLGATGLVNGSAKALLNA